MSEEAKAIQQATPAPNQTTIEFVFQELGIALGETLNNGLIKANKPKNGPVQTNLYLVGLIAILGALIGYAHYSRNK